MKMKNKIILTIFIVIGASIHGIYAQCTAMNPGTIDYSTTATSVTLNWFADFNATDYTIAYGTNGFDPETDIGSMTDQSGNSLTVNSLVSGTTYNFWIRTNCTNGSSSDWVGPLNITPSDTLCENVSSVTNTSLTDTTADFSWIGTQEASSYHVKYGPSGFNVNTEGTLIVSANTNMSILGLTANTAYDVYVRSVCLGGNSNWSSAYPITTTGGGGVGLVKSGSKYYTGSYRPTSNKKYVLSAWVKEVEAGASQPPTYTNAEIGIYLVTIDGTSQTPITVTSTVDVFQPSGNIIEGWQRIQGVFTLPTPIQNLIDEHGIQIQLKNTSQGLVDVYFDDVRVFPFNGNMKSFVYDDATKKLLAELDENNYATYYEYDKEGGLVRVKKETEKGIYTIQETRSSNAKN